MIVFNKKDGQFLKAVGIIPDSRTPNYGGTARLLMESGIPLTWKNWLLLAFAGNPPAELDAEIEAEIAGWEDADDICNVPSGGMSNEPTYSTPAGFPICRRCNRSTRTVGRLFCRPCISGTRLPLTAEDRR